MSRLLRLLLLAATLLWAQFALAEHGVTHALEGGNAACIECQALPGFAALPAVPVVLPRSRVAVAAPASAAPPAPTFSRSKIAASFS
ncbi:hypothetical protein [Sulfuricystis multivorans]|uniref:hypothetical protein n=1 Tax=Sulfuricystis multivorans TaxID=2211108 RepID=UPI000F8346B2|nr:hypothetical protein [Sulfuricystis multivorans]